MFRYTQFTSKAVLESAWKPSLHFSYQATAVNNRNCDALGISWDILGYRGDIFPQHHGFLVGGIPTPLKNMSSSVGMIIPNIWKNKKCSTPPTRWFL